MRKRAGPTGAFSDNCKNQTSKIPQLANLTPLTLLSLFIRQGVDGVFAGS